MDSDQCWPARAMACNTLGVTLFVVFGGGVVSWSRRRGWSCQKVVPAVVVHAFNAAPSTKIHIELGQMPRAVGMPPRRMTARDNNGCPLDNDVNNDDER